MITLIRRKSGRRFDVISTFLLRIVLFVSSPSLSELNFPIVVIYSEKGFFLLSFDGEGTFFITEDQRMSASVTLSTKKEFPLTW